MTPRRRPLLVGCGRRLRADLRVLGPAFAFARAATQRFLAERTDGSLFHEVTVLYAAWVHFAFAGDEAAYRRHLEDRLARHDPASPLAGLLYAEIKGGHWGWSPPEDEAGGQAVRMIDRIDLGLNFLRRHLGVSLPAELLVGPEPGGTWSIAAAPGEEARQALLTRLTHLAEAACEVFGG